MYASHFGLAAEPFDLAPNPDYLYLGKQYREAMNALKYGLADRRGFITLIGEVGTGKTTILYQLLTELPEDMDVAFVSYADQPFGSLLSLLLTDLGVAHDSGNEASMLTTLNTQLRERDARGRTVAFVIDESQNLTDDTLERLRLLSNIETSNKKLLQILLAGQPEFQRRMHEPHMRQLNERVSVRACLNPLPRRELLAYVTHRLQRVGGNLDKVTTWPARAALLFRARGLPRRANILFHNSLLFACGRRAPRVTLPIALSAIREMNDRPVQRIWRSVLRHPQPAMLSTAIVLAALLLGRELRHLRTEAPVSLADGAATAPAGIPVVDQSLPATANASTPPVMRVAPAPEPAAVPAAPTPPREAVAAAPTPEPTPPAGIPTTIAEAVARPVPGGDGETVLLWVARGTTLRALAQQLHGHAPTEGELAHFIEAVQTLNPQVTNPNLIIAGNVLRVPLIRPAPGSPPA